MAIKQTLEAKSEEKDRLRVKYRAAKRQEWAELCEREPRLAVLRKTVRRLQSPTALLSWLADSWVRRAEGDVRFAALKQIDRYAWKMARYAGRAPLDDPLPPQRNVFLIARDLLGVR